MINNLPEKWDVEADIVAVGSGLGGLGGAITAHFHGASALILERAEQIGGVSAMSMGEVWVPGNRQARELGIEDSPESGFRYLQRLSMGYGEDAAIFNLTVHAPIALAFFEDEIGLKPVVIRDSPDYYYGVTNDGLAEGRLLEVEPFPAAQLGEWQSRTRVSPAVPYGLTHVDIFSKGGPAHVQKWDFALMGERLEKDERCLGPGLVAYFVKGVLDRKIPIRTGANVQELIADGQRVCGLRAVINGKNIYVKANRGIVIAVSGHEKNQEYNKTLSTQLNLKSMLFPGIDGAGFRLAGMLGARIARVPEMTSLGFMVPGEMLEHGEPFIRNAMPTLGLPHTIVVNRAGKRFGNEAFYRQLLFVVDQIDGATQTHPNYPCWAILDSQAREKYPLGSIMPGQDMPAGMGEKADTIAALAGKIGADAQNLAATIAEFNKYAVSGLDPQFGRGTQPWSTWLCGDPFNKPHPNLGTVEKPPFYAVPLHRAGFAGIPATGLVIDHHCRVIGWDDKPIPGLYAAGNAAARMETGAVMQSGISNARGIVHGYLAARHAAGHPSPLLQTEAARLGL